MGAEKICKKRTEQHAVAGRCGDQKVSAAKLNDERRELTEGKGRVGELRTEGEVTRDQAD